MNNDASAGMDFTSIPPQPANLVPFEKPKKPPRSSAPKRAQTGVLAITPETIGQITAARFIAARIMSGLDQRSAADKLGYKNSSPLCKIEAGDAGVPTYMIARAAQVYGVSMDYLIGLSDYPERDMATVEAVALMRSVRGQIGDWAMQIARKFMEHGGDAQVMASHVSVMTKGIGECFRHLVVLKKSIGAEAIKPMEQAIEAAMRTAEKAERHLKRRQCLKAYEYLDGVEKEYPLLHLIEQAKSGIPEARKRASYKEQQLELLSVGKAA